MEGKIQKLRKEDSDSEEEESSDSLNREEKRERKICRASVTNQLKEIAKYPFIDQVPFFFFIFVFLKSLLKVLFDKEKNSN